MGFIIYTYKSEPNGTFFADDISKYCSFKENYHIFIDILLNVGAGQATTHYPKQGWLHVASLRQDLSK